MMDKLPAIARYAAATLPPMALLILAGTAWGGFAWVALAWLTVIAAVADRFLAPPVAPPDEEDTAAWSDTLSVGLALGHLLVLVSTVSAIASGAVTMGQGIALFLATASFFGQVSHPNAHELIHRATAPLRVLGATVYTSVAFGHHVSAHRLVHHRSVGTEDDPNTPLPDESFWDYLPRAWRGSFEAGLASEMEKLERKGRPYKHFSNPYWMWVGGAALAFILCFVIAGVGGAIVWLALVAFTGAQILMSDYIQHYGLQRLILPNGRLEPVSAHHSWNAPRGFSSYLMMNAPAHSEHHMHPDRHYEHLDPQANVPTLPYSMPIMAMIATIPPVWSRIMNKRALKVMEAAQKAAVSPPRAPEAAPRRAAPPNREAAPTAAAPAAAVTSNTAAPAHSASAVAATPCIKHPARQRYTSGSANRSGPDQRRCGNRSAPETNPRRHTIGQRKWTGLLTVCSSLF